MVCNRMKVFVPEYLHDAGKWIYQGYYNAWKNLGYEVYAYTVGDLEGIPKDSYVMAVDSKAYDFEKLATFEKIFLYCRNNEMPFPYGTHPNFVCDLEKDKIEFLNNCKNVIKFNFGKVLPEYMSLWKDVHYIPLAFDNISYKNLRTSKHLYDVCFIGGWAHNGFNEKQKIIKDTLSHFQNSKLKCGFFVNKNISHEEENKILCNSKVCLNIHDGNQRKYGLDTNERTFKAYGCCGYMLSDGITCLYDPPLNKFRWDTTGLWLNLSLMVEEWIEDPNLPKIKKHNFEEVKKHTYTERVKELLQWI